MGQNEEFARRFLSGELEVELTPQGTLAERLPAGGMGIPGFLYTSRGRHPDRRRRTQWRYDAWGEVVLASPPKETHEFDCATCDLERGIRTEAAGDIGVHLVIDFPTGAIEFELAICYGPLDP